ncbi:hypothetical protein SLEP1_g36001 [Rubroshorea leprosula]|uniref:Uncharacterized protein n=1 Tax=Rubroshorea leprosula TaxID=152421 RepID=A0AAV5KQ87_9ROSI|nr:hypothetical protein SLEP1_g36001 [Rubroshorea leprosula]
MSIAAAMISSRLLSFRVYCSDSNPRRGFGAQKGKQKANKVTTSREKDTLSQQRKSTTQGSDPLPTQAPGLRVQFDGKSNTKSLDSDFEERLQAIKRAALEQKKAEENKEFGPIDYDAPVESEKNTIGIGTKIGVGVAVVVFGLVFALGDFLPSGSINSTEEAAVVDKRLSQEEKSALQTRLRQFEETLSSSPKDPTALEGYKWMTINLEFIQEVLQGAAVTLVELGDYSRANSLLQDLAKIKTSDPDVFRLLGEVKYELKDYDGSVAAYKISTMVSTDINFEVLRGLTNAFLAAKKPEEAVQYLLSIHERLNKERSSISDLKPDSNAVKTESENLDPVQVDLLLGKAYSDWGHVSDAVAVYDGLIASHPNDFRGYLAKGIILKENGNVGDAARMFIQVSIHCQV